jgi:hypothetical protein
MTSKNTSKKPMTSTERKRKSRAGIADSGRHQLSCYVNKETYIKIASFADSKGLSQGEALDIIVNDF